MEIKRNTAAKYLGVFIDEHPTWKENTTVIQNKVSKKFSLLYRDSRVLHSTALKNMYFSFVTLSRFW